MLTWDEVIKEIEQRMSDRMKVQPAPMPCPDCHVDASGVRLCRKHSDALDGLTKPGV